jgi:hypothetical protein
VALAVAGDAQACSCAAAPLEERLDDADAAIVGTVVSEEVRDLRGLPQRHLTIQVDQRVKGDVERTIVVRTPLQTSCDISVAVGAPIGLLLTRAPEGAWLANLCSVVSAGELVAAGGEPRGGAIKVVLGVIILAIVLSWALRRRLTGKRPNLPGAPEP